MKIKFINYLTVLLIVFSSLQVFPQVQGSVITLSRGKLWQSVFNGKVAPTFSNWRRVGVGLDWPGFDPSWVNQNLGGSPSYMLTGGFIVGAKRTNDSVMVVEDWAISSGTISQEPTQKYIITKHVKSENHWLQKNPASGEETVETIWEFNPNYTDAVGINQQLPIRVKRVAHQWNGNKRDENYIIYEYTFTNISKEIKDALTAAGDTSRLKVVPDTLVDFYAMATYAMHANSRSWTVLFPSESPGARNTWYFYDATRKMIWGRASDFLSTSKLERDYGFANSQGMILEDGMSGEFLAPGFVGLRLLYASPNKNNQTSRVNGYGWSAGDNSFDYGGPLSNKNTEIAQYDVIKDPTTANSAVKTSIDSLMRRSRMWSMMSLGPWNLNPGDSIKVVLAEMVDGVDYKYAVDTAASSLIGVQGNKIFLSTADKALFTYNNGFNHPDPPAAPKFEVDFFKERERFVANEIKWSDEHDNFVDPDDGVQDLAGYKVYRSAHLPIGPWDSVGVVLKKSPVHYNGDTRTYTFIDSAVQIGTSYYYALTAFDSGRVNWNINPNANFEETGTTKRVPPMESSIFANRKITRFTATLPSASSLDNVVVVPNPYIIGEGRSQPGEGDRIQFINLPNPCTIRIYNIRGDLIKTITVADGEGAIASWDQVTDYGQFVESGVYVFHVESSIGTKIGKFSIIR